MSQLFMMILEFDPR